MVLISRPPILPSPIRSICLSKLHTRWATQVTTYRKGRPKGFSSTRYLNWSTGRLLPMY